LISEARFCWSAGSVAMVTNLVSIGAKSIAPTFAPPAATFVFRHHS
jgi:hypothetical protein